MSRLNDYVRDVYLLEGQQRCGSLPRYEREFRDKPDAWLAGWYQGMVEEALDMMPRKLVAMIAEEE